MGSYFEQQIGQLRRELTRLRSGIAHAPDVRPNPSRAGLQQRWFPYANGSGETIPAWSCVRITNWDQQNKRFNVAKPDVTGRFFPAAFSYGRDVADTKFGRLTFDLPTWAAYDSAATPAIGQRWGPDDDAFDLVKFSPGFVVLGDPVDDERVLVDWERDLMILGQYQDTGTVAQDASGNVDVYYYSGTTWTSASLVLMQAGSEAAVLNPNGPDITKGNRIAIEWEPNGKKFLAGPLEC